MSTFLTFPENLDALFTSSKTAQKQVDELMEMDKEAKESDRSVVYGSSCSGIYVWLDSGCFGNSIGSGYYYVRLHDPRTRHSTAYDSPDLIVKKSKLRPDQIEFMENKCAETKVKLAKK